MADPTPRIWHSLSMSNDGNVIVAGEGGGLLHVSHDGGASWTAGNSSFATWISSAQSAGGAHLYAVQYGGSLYTSSDFGASWTAITSSPLVHGANGIAWEAITVSQDARRIAGVVQQGPIVLSGDGGATWRAAQLPDGQAAHWWRWVDSSQDGSVIVAVSHNGEIARSTDAGASWRFLQVAVGGANVTESWYRVKLSADGSTIALVANSFGGAPGTGVYVSHDGGASWTKPVALVADYTFLAMSADGSRIAATLSTTGANAGRVLLSSDGGASFAAMAVPANDNDWRAIAMSAAGDRLAAATGAFNTQSTGLLYTAR